MAVNVTYYDPEPQGGHGADARVAYWFDSDSMTIRTADHPQVVDWVGEGNTIGAYQPPPEPATPDQLDTQALNAALTQPGSVTRAMGELLFKVMKGTEVIPQPSLTKNQFVQKLKALMRNGS
jgi:hypothetical protein